MLAVLLVACGGSSGETELFSGDPADAGHDGAGGSGDFDSGDEADGGSGGSSGVCAPGQSVACVGPGGCEGGQVCRSDGAGYEPCECAPGGDGGSGGVQDAGPDAPDTTGWKWWCIYTPPSNKLDSCDCTYGAAGTGNENTASCPSFDCCYMRDVNNKAASCHCHDTFNHKMCDDQAASAGAYRVSSCP